MAEGKGLVTANGDKWVAGRGYKNGLEWGRGRRKGSERKYIVQ